MLLINHFLKAGHIKFSSVIQIKIVNDGTNVTHQLINDLVQSVDLVISSVQLLCSCY